MDSVGMKPTNEFSWSHEDEPHAKRAQEILLKYPQIKELFGPDVRLFPCVVIMCMIQIISCVYVPYCFSWPVQLLICWVVGGSISHSLSLANHELCHNLCFKSNLGNEILAVVVNCVQAIPSSTSFNKYHLDHHARQGYDLYDVDIATRTEGALFINAPLKILFLVFMPFIYALRPLIINPKPVCSKTVIYGIVVLMFDLLVVYFLGINSLFYLLLADWLGLGAHPMVGHFISEHFEFCKGQETYSYYGPLNYLTFNVGYHNEHHDFPRVSGFKLPEITKIAPEFYKERASYTSWSLVLWRFVFDPKITPFSRIKRFPLSGSIAKRFNIKQGFIRDI